MNMSTTSTFKPANLYIDTNIVDPQTGAPLVSIVTPGYLTPPQIAIAYGLPASTGAGIKVGIISPGGGGFLQSDLDKAFVDLKAAGLISPSIAAPTINKYLFDGASGAFAGVGEGAATFENTLDIYCVATLVPEATINMYIGYDYTNPVQAAIADGCDIITISWAGSEYSYGYYETLWTQCAAAGVTVVAASGDWGSILSGATTLSLCYPAASPQVISIGGTKLAILNGTNARVFETDDNRDPSFGSTWGGGGGISDIFPLPSWQNNLKYTPIVGGVTGSPTPLPRRGVPDVSAPMNAYAMYYGGSVNGVGGTSASAPVWAGILARMQKLTGVKRTSAQYNTIFYANTSSFYDITVGTNNTQIADGYAGTVDWDPVTGLGPPKGASLLSILTPVASSLTATVNTSLVTLYQNVAVTPFAPITATGGDGNYSYGISPSLPSGLAYDTLNGEISGMPQVRATTATYTISITDGLGASANGHFSLGVTYTPLTATVDHPTNNLNVGVVVTPVIPVSGHGGFSSMSYGVSPSLPSGLTYDTLNGEISGIPQVVSATATYTVSIVDLAGQTASGQFSLSASYLPIEITVNRLSATVYLNKVVNPFTPISATGGGGNFTYSITPSLPTGLNFNTSTGEITGTPLTESSAATYTITATDQFAVSASGYFTLTSTKLRIQATSSSFVVRVSESITPFTSVLISGWFGLYTYAISPALPNGLTFNSSTSAISGTPLQTSPARTYTVTCTDALGQVATANFTLESAVVPYVVVSKTPKVVARLAETINIAPLVITGGSGNVVFSITPSLPTGFTLNSHTGYISGSLDTTSHSRTYTITATDDYNQTVSTQFTLKVRTSSKLIDSDTQNTVYDTLFSLMGTTSTGYGAILLGYPVNAGDLIVPNDWNKLIQDIERCLIHQTGSPTNSIFEATTGTKVKFATPATMYTAVKHLQENVGTAHPSQLASFTHNTRREISTSGWTSTNYSSTSTMLSGQEYMTAANWSWFYPNQLNYFFNLGGKIQPKIRVVGGDHAGVWAGLIAAANNVVFGRNEFHSALASPDKSYTFVVRGQGNWQGKKQLRQTVQHISVVNKVDKDTTDYSANALTVKFTIMDNTIVGSLNFQVGLGKHGKGKKVKVQSFPVKVDGTTFIKDIFTRNILGKYIRVKVGIETDFQTTYPTGANGGIAAQVPQTQIIANSLSANPAPIPEFTTGVDEVTDVKTVTLRNNSTITCVVSNIVLTGYTTGTVTPTSMTIEPARSAEFSLQYEGFAPGYFRGYVDIINNVNPLTLFTEVNVGSTDPKSVELTTSTYDLISQDFVVNHAGGYFKDFSIDTTPSDGFTYTDHVGETIDTFNISFNPHGLSNGTYSTIVTVTVNPLDSSQEAKTWTVPMTVHLNVDNRHIADWTSCILGTDTIMSLSYDIIGGRTYLTMGIGTGVTDIHELRLEDETFTTWDEVYRIQLTGKAKLHSATHCIKSAPSFKYGDSFGAGTARGSIITADYDGKGNLGIVMNTLYSIPGQNTVETLDMSTAFRYYDSRRANQLQLQSELVQGGETYIFNGFDKDGDTLLGLVGPN